MIPSLLFFGVCGLALLLAAWVAHRQDPDATVTELFDRAMADRTVRIALIVCWWWLGWHFLAGQTVDPAPIG